MRTGDNIHLRKDGRYEARYIKERDAQGRIIYGYCYGRTYAEAKEKRDALQQPKALAIRELSLLILGAGSHGEEVMELAQELRIFRRIGFLDDVKVQKAIGPCENFENYVDAYPVAIPAIGNSAVRRRWTSQLVEAGFLIPTLIHPTAVVSHSATVGVGTVICARATIGPGVQIGQGCIISSGATVNRDVVIPDFAYVDCGETVTLNTDISKLVNAL